MPRYRNAPALPTGAGMAQEGRSYTLKNGFSRAKRINTGNRTGKGIPVRGFLPEQGYAGKKMRGGSEKVNFLDNGRCDKSDFAIGCRARTTRGSQGDGPFAVGRNRMHAEPDVHPFVWPDYR